MSKELEYVDLGEDPLVIGLKVKGTLSAASIAEFIERIETIRAGGDKARVYIDLTDYEGFELPVVREKAAHIGTLWNGIERCAYVVDAQWMMTALGLVDAITPMHLRAFTATEDASARDWVRAGAGELSA